MPWPLPCLWRLAWLLSLQGKTCGAWCSLCEAQPQLLTAAQLLQLPPQGLLGRFTGIEVPAKESLATGRDDRGTLVAELDQPAAIPLQHGQGDFNGERWLVDQVVAGRPSERLRVTR